MLTMRELQTRHAGAGKVVWLGLRPERRAPMVEVAAVEIDASGLVGDRSRGGKRAVTLIQAEHLQAIAALAARPEVRFGDLRRNIGVAGINLLALRARQVRLGTAVLEITGPCAPCSRLEEALGPGGYSAVRGHGGMTASVVSPGTVALGGRLDPL